MKRKEYLKVVLILPGNVLVTIPFLITALDKKWQKFKSINGEVSFVGYSLPTGINMSL